MASKVFTGMQVFEPRPSGFALRKPAPLDRLITANSVGRRVEIGIDENDVLSVRVHRDESGEVGMDAVLRALEDNE
jgi:hypothetical protein